MKVEELVRHVQGRAPFQPDEAKRAVDVTLGALVSCLAPGPARQLLRELAWPDAPFVASGLSATDDQALGVLARRVADEQGIELQRALEHVEIVGRALAELLDETVLGKLRRELPEPVAHLLTPGGSDAGRTPAAVHHDRTLAEGRPGSRRPLSEAAPGSEHPLSEGRSSHAQRHSVADANPHADSKLSSTTGFTQERERESLARGKGKL